MRESIRLVYSEPQLAIDSGFDYFATEEENVYVMPVFYPSGVEYHLKKECDIVSDCRCLKKYELKETHKFHKREHALKAIKYFRKKGKRLCYKKEFEEKNGYKFVKNYYLCSM